VLERFNLQARASFRPYWWLKCLVGLKNEEHPLGQIITGKFLEWDIMKKPRFSTDH